MKELCFIVQLLVRGPTYFISIVLWSLQKESVKYKRQANVKSIFGIVCSRVFLCKTWPCVYSSV